MNEEQTRSQYLQALMNQRKTFNASGNNLVNPSVSNDIGTLAMVNTNFQQGVNKTNVPTEQDVENTSNTEEKKERNVIENIVGFADDITAKFGAGFTGAFEGIIDLFATGIAAIGEGTGWYNTEGIRDFIAIDHGQKMADWTSNWLPWNVIKNIGDEEWRNTVGQTWWGFLPFATAMGGFGTDAETLQQWKEKYTIGGNQVLSDMGQFGDLLGGVSYSVGNMLPSIMTGGAASAAGAGNAAVKAISLASLGVSAAGKGSEQAIQEGAGSGQALAYGALSGGGEVLSELAIGPVLAKVGVGTGKIMGVVGGKTVKTTSKSFVKELIKGAFEEGMEEVSTALVEPLFKAVYKGQEALDEYKDPAKFLFGVGGNFSESVLGQFTAGAVTSGIMSGVNTKSMQKKFGKDGFPVVEKFYKAMDDTSKTLKIKDTNSTKYKAALEAQMKSWTDTIEAWNEAQGKLTDKQLENIRKAISNPSLLLEGSTDINQISYELNTMKDVNKAQAVMTKAAQDAARSGYKIEFSDSMGEDSNAQIDKTKKVITLNSKMSDKYGSLLAHEYVSHVLVENFGGTDKVNSLATQIKGTEWFKDYEKSLTEQYKINDTKYQNLLETKGHKAAEDYFNSEVLANYVQLETEAKGSGIAQVQALQKMLKKEGVAQKFLKSLNLIKTNSNAIMEEVGRVARIAIEASNNKTLKSLLNKIKSYTPYDKLTENEKAAWNNYSNVFEGMMKASKKIDKVQTDSKGNKLSEKQVEFFKDSKARDKNGKLVPVYHATDHFGFSTFNQKANDYGEQFIDISDSRASILEQAGLKFVRNGLGSIIDFDLSDFNSEKYLDINGIKAEDLDTQGYESVDKYVRSTIIDELLDNYKREKYHGFYFSSKKNVASTYKKDASFDYFAQEKLKSFGYEGGADYYGSDHNFEFDSRLFDKAKTSKDILDIAKDVCEKFLGIDNVVDVAFKRYYSGGHSTEYSKEDFLKNKKDTVRYGVTFMTNNGDIDTTVNSYFFNKYYDEYEEYIKKERNIYSVYLDLKNPLIVNSNNGVWDSVVYNEKRYTMRDLTEIAFKDGYDGVIVKKVFDVGGRSRLRTNDGKYPNRSTYQFQKEGTSDIYVAFDSNQIKSVDNLNPTLNEDIYKSKKLEKSVDRFEKLKIDKKEFKKTANEFIKETTADKKSKLYDMLAKKLDDGYTVDGNVLYKNKVPFAKLVAKWNEENNNFTLSKIINATEADTYKDSKIDLSDGQTVYFSDSKGLYYSAKISSNWDGTYKAEFRSKGQHFVKRYSNFSQLKNALLSYTNVSNDRASVIDTLNKHDTKRIEKEVAEEKRIRDITNQVYDIKEIEGSYITDKGNVVEVTKSSGAYILKDGKVETKYTSIKTIKKALAGLKVTKANIEGLYTINKGNIHEQKVRVLRVGKHYEIVDLRDGHIDQYTNLEDTYGALKKLGIKTFGNKKLVTTRNVSNDQVLENAFEKVKGKTYNTKNEALMDYSDWIGKDNVVVSDDTFFVAGEPMAKANIVEQDGKFTIESISNEVNQEAKINESNVQVDKSVLTEKQAEGKEVVEKRGEMVGKNVFKTFTTTKGIVNNTLQAFQEYLPDGYKISVPRNLNKFASTALSKINSVRTIALQAKRVVDMTLSSTVRYNNVSLGKLSDILSKDAINSIQTKVEDIIKNSKNETALKKATKSFEMEIDRLMTKLTEAGSQVHTTRVFTNQRRLVKDYLKKSVEINDDYILRNGLDFLLQPIFLTEGNSEGSIYGYKAKNVKQNFIEVLSKYNELKNNVEKYDGLPYHEEVANMLQDIIDSIGEPTVDKRGRQIYGGLTNETLSLMNDYIKCAMHLAKQVKTVNRVNILPSAIQSYEVIKTSNYGIKNNILTNIMRSWKRGFSASYAVLREILGGNSVISRTLTTDMQVANNERSLYKGGYSDLVNKELKKLGIRKTFDVKTFQVDGKKITADQALYLYISLNVDANYNAINESGMKYYDQNKHFVKFAEPGNAEFLKGEVSNVLPSEYKKFGDFLLSVMNENVKSDYIKWFESTFGQFNGRNEIGSIGENTYWTLKRAYERITNLEKAVSNPAAIFSHSKSRQINDREVVLGGALSTFSGYIDKLSSELYIKPVYRQAIAMLNTKVSGNNSIRSLLGEKLTSKDISYLENTMKDMLGALNNTNDILSTIVSTYSVAKLSLNIGSVLKQYAAAWTSNIPISKSTKALFARIFRNANVRTEYKQLLEEIGGLKYRESSKTVLKANADAPSYLTSKIADFGMWGMSKADMFTTSTGAIGLMYIAQDQMGLKIGTNENKEWVKKHWAEFELSQPGSSSLSRSAISRGDFGSITKALFGFLQGDNRASFGSQINKIDLYLRNRKVNELDLKAQLSQAEEALKQYENIDISELEKEQADQYIKARTSYENAKVRLADYEDFKIAGGKVIPINMTAGLVAQGVFITLINELIKHLKGKKDWDEWDILELGGNTLLSIGVDWLPLVNAITNMIQGYDVTIPAVDLLNQMVDIFNDINDGDVSAIIRKIALLVGDMTGIPFQTLYQYMYSFVKAFNPEVAYQMNSVLYGTSSASLTKTLNTYIEKGDERNSRALIGIALDRYRVISSDNVKDEILSLVMSGYKDCMPKQYMAEYTDSEGNATTLNAKEIEAFRALYNQADNVVRGLLSNSVYRSMTQEQRAKMLKKIYDAYYSYAKCKVTGSEPDTKLAKLLVLTNGNVDLAKYIVYMQKIGTITANKTKTRKELVAEYVNKITGMNKSEKLLLLYMSGFSLADNNKTSVYNYLKSSGGEEESIIDYLDL